MSRITSRQDLEVARNPVVALKSGDSKQTEQTPLFAGVMQIKHEVLHFIIARDLLKGYVKLSAWD